MKIVQYAGPTSEPISIDDLMLHLRIDDDESLLVDDLTALIISARETVETITRRQLLTATWDYYLDAFPGGKTIDLPFGNLQTVTHIKYTDSSDVQTTMTVTTEYLVQTNGEGLGRIVLPYGETWPSFTENTNNPIVIRYVCGWTLDTLIPGNLRLAVKLAAEDLYYHGDRHAVLDPAIQGLCSSYRLWDEF
jgi:uncharacterized phiE125 gp8 family phage protein